MLPAAPPIATHMTRPMGAEGTPSREDTTAATSRCDRARCPTLPDTALAFDDFARSGSISARSISLPGSRREGRLRLELRCPEAAVEVGEQRVALPRHRVHDERRVRREALRVVRLEHRDLAALVVEVAEQLPRHVDEAHAAVVVRLIEDVVLHDDVV